MQRLTGAWFEFDGVKSTAKGVIITSMPRRTIPAERGEQITVPGRSGFVWIGENGARENIQIDVQCESTTGYTPESVNSWLLGRTAFLRFSDEQGYAYKARCISSFGRENKFLSFDKQTFTVTFDCQPYRYVYPAPTAVNVTASGTMVTNGGTVDSMPSIMITATGDYSVTINGYPVEVTGGSIVIDSELMDCFNADGVTLANGRVTMTDYPKLRAGNNVVSWTGNVTSVSILLRSRAI